MDSIGNRLREERRRVNRSQTELGDVAGITKNTQMLYESDKRLPKADYLVAVAAIGIDVLYVLTGERTKPQPVQDEAEASTYIDARFLAEIVDRLEDITTQAGKRWRTADLIRAAAEVYNFMMEEGTRDEEKVERVLRLVVNR